MRERGFTLIETLIAMAITLVVLAAATGIFKSLADANVSVSQGREVELNLQAGLYLMKRDLANAGSSYIPRAGIQVPSNVRRPPLLNAPASVSLFGASVAAPTAANPRMITAINPGMITTPGIPAGIDIVNILLPRELQGGRRIEGVAVIFRTDGGTIRAEVDIDDLKSRTGFETLADAGVRAGDLVFFDAGAVTTLRHVTSIEGKNIRVQPGEVSNLNVVNTAGVPNPNPADGAGGSVTLLKMVTYYRDTSTSELMRQINYGPATPMATGVENLQLTYEVTSGVTDTFTGCGSAALEEGKLTSAAVSSPQKRIDIRKVNVTLACRSEDMTLPAQKVAHNGRVAQVYVANLNICNPYREDNP